MKQWMELSLKDVIFQGTIPSRYQQEGFSKVKAWALIMKPKSLSPDELDKMVRAGKFVQVADWLNAYVVKQHPDKENLRKKWMVSKDPMTARAGWSLTSGRIARDPEGLDLPALLDRIEAEMPNAAAEVQWTISVILPTRL